MFVIKICHSYEQFYITVTKKKLSYEMHQYDKQCLLLLQKIFYQCTCVCTNAPALLEWTVTPKGVDKGGGGGG